MLAVLALVLSLASGLVPAPTGTIPAAAPGIEVTLVGNAGFLLRGPSHALVIDGLVEPEETSTDHFHTFPPAWMLASLIRGPSAEPALDLALVTHAHRDHVDPGVAASFLRHNRNAILVGPRTVVEIVGAAGGHRLARQLEAVGGGPGGRPLRLDWSGGTVTAIPAFHSGHPGYVLENVLYVAELDGVRMLHVGDVVPSATAFTEIDPGLLAVDVAFLPSWFVTDREGRDVVTRLLHPRCVVLMHLPAGRAEEAAGWAREAAEQDRGFPRIVLLEMPGDSETIVI